MRPLSLASYDVLLRTGNPLVKGEMPTDGTPEFTSAILGFVFTHCAPWPEVVRASFDGQRFRESALIFSGSLTRNWLARGTGFVHAAGATLPVSPLPAAAQRRSCSLVFLRCRANHVA